MGVFRFLLLCVAILVSATTITLGQSAYDVNEITLSNARKGAILTDLDDRAVLLNPIFRDYISNWNLSEPDGYQLLQQPADFSEKELANTGVGLSKVSCSAFSRAAGTGEIVYGNTTYDKASIYHLAHSDSTAKLLLEGTGTTQYIHPFISDDGSQIFFSSNLESTYDNFDIFFINKLANGWSAPVRLAAAVNTGESQVFPTLYDDTLFYSTLENNQLNLFKSAKADLFKTIEKLKTPFNSDGDDYLLFKTEESGYYLNSKRKSKTSRIYNVIEKQAAVTEKMSLTGYLACSGNRISQIPISLTTVTGRLIDEDITDESGNFIFRADKNIKRYKLKLKKKDPRIKDCAVLYLTDNEGNVLQKILINDEGEFIFETISPDEISGLNTKSIDDESLLQIGIEGQIYENKLGDVGKGEPVKIMSENGEMIALAYTSKDGKFRFSDLSPEAKYNLQFDKESKQLKLNIIKNGEVIPVVVENNEAVYQRIDDSNSIELIDDRGKGITIEKDEFFKLQNIFYDENSAELSAIAQFQLDRFAQFIFNNDEISIELISHTDSKGQADYNLNLSQKRSESAKAHLMKKGVRPERIKAYGMGEKDLLNRCADGVNCSDREHAVNRRTEIRIIVIEE